MDAGDDAGEPLLKLWLTHDETTGLLGISTKTLASYERRGLLHPRIAMHSPVYDPKEILSLLSRTSLARASLLVQGDGDKSAITDFYVAAGTISPVEFRMRYGYVCKRSPCVYCQHVHARGMGRSCKNDEASGTRYSVRRADGSRVCAEVSAIGAWKTSHQLESDRLAPILIARDALAEGRFIDAMMIAGQLSPDLAVPLRREIASTVDDLTNSTTKRYICGACDSVYVRWTPRCPRCLSLALGAENASERSSQRVSKDPP